MEVNDTNVEQHFEKLNLSVTPNSPPSDGDRSVSSQPEAEDEIGPLTAPETSANRRFMLRPRKRVSGHFGTLDLTSPKVGRLETSFSPKPASTKRNPNLETIFEEPVVKKNGAVVLIGTSKIKRAISFQQFVSKTKARKRKALVKKFNFGRKKKTSLTLNDLKVKLSDLDNALHIGTND
ncbi:hypothetical protein LSTR_LSTR001415 [Laodelphax striatellus]|uniref:Tantalus-like domain-containing protein n=1 Tax=Laodelphax striatellus TaxID=195883 RepID=A0A482XAT1_LAOST|nr:hypothetical protein LSTR_LSTR016701 [Laodelphax striatellus]RZF42620.1 hypothetical protein LSTR_LSTR001415 [Laodelphax striatellus]